MAYPEAAQSLLGPQMFGIKEAMDEAHFSGSLQSPAYAATVTTIVADPVTVVVVGTLTGNITIAAPVGARAGMKLTYCFTQDGTGGRTVTWNAVFAASANSGSTANHKAATTFVYDGSRWVQDAGAMTFKA